jgi:hypothetical protein
VIDIVDTLIKDQLGLPAPPTLVYLPFMLLWMITSAVAFFVSNRTFHALSASLFLIILIVWISWMLSGIMGFVLVT